MAYDIREVEANSVPDADVATHLAAVTLAALQIVPGNGDPLALAKGAIA